MALHVEDYLTFSQSVIVHRLQGPFINISLIGNVPCLDTGSGIDIPGINKSSGKVVDVRAHGHIVGGVEVRRPDVSALEVVLNDQWDARLDPLDACKDPLQLLFDPLRTFVGKTGWGAKTDEFGV